MVPNGKRVKDQTFGFDRIFDENATQEEVFEATTKNLLDSVLDGYNATVFAYGATGCGKTHTITGTPQEPGIIHLTMQDLFERISEHTEEKTTEISLSYLEIYNETIRDLLVPGGSKAGLMLREDANQAVSVAGLSSHHPQNVQQVMQMIREGNAYRTMSPTEANATSSRSHAVLQINVSQKDRNADINEPHTMATLSIIDLAGSERASATKNRGERLIEGANINKSLLALGSCINALCDARKNNHVPYRNSKLTRLLKFSLGGNCKTVMIVCVSPSSQHFDETQNTLRYANRAKNIQTKVTRNVYNVNRHVKDFLVKIDEQMALIKELRQREKDYENIAFQKFRKQSEKKDLVAREGVARIRNAYDHSAAERHEKLGNMKNLRQIERRIAMISSWVAAFDDVCDSHEEGELPSNLVAMRKTAQGILIELEGSRQHYHQRLAKSNWQRAIDSALQHSLKQLADIDGSGDGVETANLTREAELLKSNAEREALLAVIEQDRYGDAAAVQTLLNAHFETVAAIGGILDMDEKEAIEAAKSILGKVLGNCMTAASQVIKPDGSMVLVEAFPPTRSGTPKRKKQFGLLGASPFKPNMAAVLVSAPQSVSSPVRASPKRRKVAVGKKGVTFTPKKRTPLNHAKRVVRWRDDTADGALAEFEKTPKKVEYTPEDIPSEPPAAIEASMPPPALPFSIHDVGSESNDSSPIPVPALTSLVSKPKNNRFKAGFLAKRTDGSPLPPTLTNFSSNSDHSPLRDLEPSKASNRSALQLVESADDSTLNGGSHISSSDTDEKWKGNRDDAMRIKTALKRASVGPSGLLNASSSAARAQRRRSPTAATSGSPPSDGSIFTASHSRRMVKSEKENDWKANVLGPRTAPVVKAASQRRTTLGEGRPRDTTISAREAVRPSTAVTGSGGNARGSLMVTGKGNWR